MKFEVNQGQAATDVGFIARSRNFDLLLAPGETTIKPHNRTAMRFSSRMLGGKAEALRNLKTGKQTTNTIAAIEATSIKMRLVGGNSASRAEGLDKYLDTVSYIKGANPQNWQKQIANYGKVRFRDVYPNIDQVFYGAGNEVEYDFIVAPSADPRAITFAFSGARDVRVDERGDLVIDTEAGALRHRAPVVYQEENGVRKFVAARYELKEDNQVSFEIGRYNTRLPLVIDPVISYSTYLGGSGSDAGFDIAIDKAGNMYVVGSTDSTEFDNKGGSDAFIAKYNSAGNLVRRTVFGGDGDDAGYSIAVDEAGNVYVTGSTDTLEIPMLTNAFQPSFGKGAQDAFVLKLAPDLSTIIYASYLGGEGSDAGFSITVNKTGNAFITGSTDSLKYSTVGGSNVFVAKLDANGKEIYLSILGGTGDDTGFDIAVDEQDFVYITGITDSDNFATKGDAGNSTNSKVAQVGFGGVQDAFVVKLNPAGSETIYSTYIGGTGSDAGFGIAVDATGSAYITGATESSEFSTLGGRNVFVEKLTPSGDDRVYFAVIGGSGDDTGFAIAVDDAGNAYVTGSTDSSNFNTVRPTQANLVGFQDAFVSKLNSSGAALVFSSYFGGESNDAGFGIGIDANKNAYVAGFSSSEQLLTVNPAQVAYAGNGDAFIARLEIRGDVPIMFTPLADAYVQGATPTTNYGTAQELRVKRTLNPGSGKGRQAYLRFDTSSATGSITRATLRVYGRLNVATGANRNIPCAVFPVSSNVWTEVGVTWANKVQPNVPNELSRVIVTDDVPRWYEFDITSYINNERAAGRMTTGVLLRNMLRGETGDYYTVFNSKEAAENQPQLVIEQ